MTGKCDLVSGSEQSVARHRAGPRGVGEDEDDESFEDVRMQTSRR